MEVEKPDLRRYVVDQKDLKAASIVVHPFWRGGFA